MDNTIGNRIKLNIFNYTIMLIVSLDQKGNKVSLGCKNERV